MPGTGGGLEDLGFHSHGECGGSRAFKSRGLEVLSYSQLPRNLSYSQLSMDIQSPTCPGRSPLIGPSLPVARRTQSSKERGP